MKILLTTLHAKYAHASLALPSLLAACEGISGMTPVIREFTVNERLDTILRTLVAEEAQAVAFSCYIWNIELTLKLVADLKLIAPGTFIILGGPEVSFDPVEQLSQNPGVDCIVCGEGEASFRELASLLASSPLPLPGDELAAIAGLCCRLGEEIVTTGERQQPGNLDMLPSPFQAQLVNLSKPLVYYETARGCPFSCAFCISSLEKGVRSYSMPRIKQDLGLLMAQQVQTIKFVDRTFNYDASRADDIWEFILANNRGSRFHFEIAADLLTESNLAVLAKVPADCFNFEIGVQSTSKETLDQVSRKTDLKKLFANVGRLRRQTAVELHLDLVAGLPGEDLSGFLASLQTLMEAWPHHIQVELLKVLKGSPMRSIAEKHGYAYSAAPPYRIHHTPWLGFGDVVRIETIAELIERIYNSGRFATTLRCVAETMPLSRFFAELAAHWGDSLQLTGQLSPLYQSLWDFMEGNLPQETLPLLHDALRYDFCLAGYPTGTLPGFFTIHEAEASPTADRLSMPEIARLLQLPKSCRIRTFTGSFHHDFRTKPWTDNPITLTFVYWTVTNNKTEISVLKSAEKANPERI
ncbi:B12-binding domain-containing radical SAM protein [Geobacter pelophilus]|uniref:B12-binding domain-containing radical SAM protein n=1 Tax=Geoanaerobacter pelophilus TaxID=60036 RepID=A0AAW4KZ10_9BACT|nr:B12-binding domain-containing radical SAM protein [Geoanaerobacter pelophilus]MBT0663614.1 B12-binding domain-containing radical SAM protein [Geoanaerobacter pelophilus]